MHSRMLDSSGAFGAGRSAGSPQGGPDISALARVHGVACIERLVRILDGPDATAAVAAACELLDRGYGRPLQPLAFDAGGITVEVDTGAEGQEAPRAGRANGKGSTAWDGR
jgi:hypothetical protein